MYKLTRRSFMAGTLLPYCCTVGKFAPQRAAATAEAQEQIDSRMIAGAVFARADEDEVTTLGLQCWKPRQLPMTAESKFDLASVGKLFTASACVLLVCEGKLDPDAPFTKYLPEHVLAKEACAITVRDLATHSGGFSNAKPYENPDMTVFHRELFAKRPVRPRGEAFEYACSNFILLGKIVERITGERLDVFCRRTIWRPLGMTHTSWDPLTDDGHVVQFPGPRRIGAHNDTTCNYCPFPTGNGSAFSTAGDMSRFVADVLARRQFPREYYQLLFTCSFEKGKDRRSFGWDMRPSSIPEGFSPKTIVHTGFTGQTVAVDPENGFAGVVLTNRLGDHAQAMDGRKRILCALFCG